MIERHALLRLREWRGSKYRKPLILRGARQVGKTTLVDEFAKEYDTYLKLNLDKRADRELFERFTDADRLLEAVYFHLRVPRKEGSVLLFIDEIQNSSQAVAMLRYFYEECPEVHVICAGSLLENTIDRKISFPVGRVEYMSLRPCSFAEFLCGMGQHGDMDVINSLKGDVIHERLMEEFRRFAIVGGMPEAIKTYSETRDLLSLDSVYESLITTYSEDVEKYSKNDTLTKVMRHVLDAGWTKGGEKVVFDKFAGSSYKSRESGEAFRTVQKAMLLELVYPVVESNLPASPDFKHRPKLIWLDAGLMNYKAQVREEIFNSTDITDAYRGRVAEQIVAQELIAHNFSVSAVRLYWEKDKKGSIAEVDFVFVKQPYLIPIEVKSGLNSKLKSLHSYMAAAPHDIAVRVWKNPLSVDIVKNSITGKPFRLINVPYYYVCILDKVLNSVISP